MAREVNSGRSNRVRHNPEPRNDFDWSFYLGRGEKLVWQGRPSGTMRIEPTDIFQIIFMLFWTGFALFWTTMAYRSAGLPFAAFGFLFIGIGFRNLWKITIGKNSQLRKTHYAITEKRALIVTDNKLKSYGIDSSNQFEIVSHGNKTSIYFDSKDSTMAFNYGKGVIKSRDGFLNIENGEQVYKTLIDLSTGAT